MTKRDLSLTDLSGLIRKLLVTIGATLVLALTAGCSDPEPIRIGFLGSISGRVNDLGIAGLNGVRLAIDLRNQHGGVDGNKIELVEEDDQLSVEGTSTAFGRLIGKRVAVVIGPMTSLIAMTAAPFADANKVVLVSPTVSTNVLSGRDDYFFRVTPSTSEFAQTSALYYARIGKKKIQVVYDLSNRAYSESWLEDFSRVFRQHGGEILPPLSYTAGEKIDYRHLVDQAVSRKPDVILIIGTSVETALFSQDIRSANKQVVIGTTEWAATDRLIALGGKNVEGIVIAQIIDHESRLNSYLEFRAEYQKRYGTTPGFAALKGFDAANVAMEAMAQKKKNESLKDALVRIGNFKGAQSTIQLDRYGDAHGNTWLYTVKEGKFVRLESAREGN